jgi:hypothetical protein
MPENVGPPASNVTAPTTVVLTEHPTNARAGQANHAGAG